jgi:hypothetical protein
MWQNSAPKWPDPARILAEKWPNSGRKMAEFWHKSWGADISVANLVAELKLIPATRGKFHLQNISGQGIGSFLRFLKTVQAALLQRPVPRP